MEEKTLDLVLFDVDGTLVEPFTAELLPGVLEFFKGPLAQLKKVAFVSNQGGVGLRHWMETGEFGNPAHLPTEHDALTRLQTIADRLAVYVPGNQYADLHGTPQRGIPVFAAFAYQAKSKAWSPTPPGKEAGQLIIRGDVTASYAEMWRKPEPGMLDVAIATFRTTPDRVLVVGDLETDQAAATAAGCRFSDADAFFNRPTRKE